MSHTPGLWLMATSNSWRRIVNDRGVSVCEPITQRDGHPDLYFRNGGEDGPDARLILAAPKLLALLRETQQIGAYGFGSTLAERIEGAIAEAT